MSEPNIDKFFATARERYLILLRRRAGEPKPWTQDKVFQSHRFCNVLREDDRTTTWFRENIRDKVKDNCYAAIIAIVAFRWFNRIETAKIIQDLLLDEWNSEVASERLLSVTPVVTGAYIIKTPDGMNKLTGVLTCIDWFIEKLNKGEFNKILLEDGFSHQKAQELLQTAPYLGRFMAYQVIADARYTCLLGDAPDINTWAQPGPGSTRGIGRIFFNDVDKFKYGSLKDEKEVIVLMRELLLRSRNTEYWPKEFPIWEMQVVQNWCCETDKY